MNANYTNGVNPLRIISMHSHIGIAFSEAVMDFTIKNIKKGVAEVSREIGYLIIDTNPNGQYNMVRKLAGQHYPRFHAYVKSRPAGRGSSMAPTSSRVHDLVGTSPSGQGNDFNFSLHLDQKQPSYETKGVHAHSGEYFGPVVEEEADRIKQIFTDK